MSAGNIAHALGGRQNGDGYICRCPAHDDRTPSLSVTDRDGRTLLKCFAGCDQEAVIDALSERGLWGSKSSGNRGPTPHPVRTANSRTSRNFSAAMAIWKSGAPIGGTLAEGYLIERGIVPPEPLPLRFHPELDYFDNAAPGGAVKLPALIAAVQSIAGNLVGIQRIFLNPAGGGKAQVASQKKALGPISGGAVRLAPVASTLALCEGIEDALALQQMTGRSAWTVLGTSGFKNFNPPPEIQTIVLAPDADQAGDQAVTEAAERLARMGLRVLHLRPPEGRDWVDVLRDFEERAAIREYDGGENRAKAELAAFAAIIGGGLIDG